MTKENQSEVNKPNPLRVLIVEDSEDDALFAIRELEKGGYTPEYERVETAAEMKNALQEKQWDIILCDYNMPMFSGPLALALLKESNIDIPVIIISGTIGEETAVECMRLGAHDYFMKGNLSRLCQAVARELEEMEIRSKKRLAESQKDEALESLRESEERYKALFDRSIDLVCIYDFDGRFIDANDAALNLFGYTREEIRSLNFASLLSEDQLTFALETTQKMKETGIQKELVEFKLLCKDGSYIYVEINGSVIMSKGNTVAIQGIARDITERKQTEEALRASEAKFTAAFNMNPIPTAITNIEDGRFLNVNDAFQELFSYSSMAEIIGKTSAELGLFANPNDRQSMRKDVEEAGRVNNREVKMVTKDGRILDTLFSAGRIFINNKASLLTVGVDITERKRAESELLESKALIEAVVENVPLMIFLKESKDLRFIVFNRAGEELLGYDRKDLLGKNNLDLFPHEQAAKFMAKDREVLDGRLGLLDIPEEHIMTAKNGQRLLHTRKVCIRGADGTTNYLLGISEDITDRKLMDEKLQQTLESLRKSFVATIQIMISAIEIRDPYTAGHQLRVADLASAIATEMGLSEDKIEGIRMAGSIHDIGKLAVPAEILSKPTKLTKIEYSLIQEHSLIGFEMLKNVESPWPLAQIVYQHHERLNGTGYPRNLKGDEIIMEARIMSVADVVEAMASHRPYRAALGIDVALEEIEKNKGVFYDAAVADACLKLFREKGYKMPV